MNDLYDFLHENNTRYRKLMRGEKPDYAPFRFWADDLLIRQYAGMDAATFMNSFEAQLEAQRRFNARFHDMHDYTVYGGVPDVYFDVERFARENPGVPHNQVLSQGFEYFDRYAQRTPIADLPGVKRLRAGIDYFRRQLPTEQCGSYYLGSYGAMDLYSIYRGTEQFFMDLYDSPSEVKRIFDFFTERSLAIMDYAWEHFRPMNGDNVLYDKVDVGEDYCAYLPADLFDEFVVPYTGAIFSRFKGKAWRSLHTDGDIHIEDIHKLAETGLDELMGFTPNVDIVEFRKALPDTVLGGNVHPIHVMMHGTPSDVKKAIRHCFEVAGANGKFVLCSGGSMSENTKLENIDAFFESVYEICKY
jgi:hypothetical protein